MTSEDTQPASEKAAPAKPAAEKPARELPSAEQIAAWAAGDELPFLANLFNLLNTKLFDALVMQIRKEELLPQHWQVISRREIPDTLVFEELGEVRRLQASYQGSDSGRGRLAALETAWRELGGKQPALWTVADLFAALRRIIDRKLEVDFYDLLSAVRDVWAGMTLPHGRTQLDLLVAVLAFVRTKTKK